MGSGQYHIIDNNEKQTGPFTFEELKQMRLHPNTPVWEEGPGGWQSAKDIKGLLKKSSSYKIKVRIKILLPIVVVALFILIFWFVAHIILDSYPK